MVLWTLEENVSARAFYEKSDFILIGKEITINRGKDSI